ncbi:MAG: SDR family oxidoreductase [Blastocatellia bacterium]
MTTRTWFITGTSSGFGRQLTEILLARGDRVAATARKTASLTDLSAKYGDHLWLAALEVTDSDAIRWVVGEAFAALGRIDIVVNNAGYGSFGAAEEYTDKQILDQINTNLVGSIRVTRAALPHLRAQGGGRIIQLSSMGGQMAFPGMSIYHATKWAIEGFFEAVMPEVAPFNIQVTLVEPGSARTSFGRNLVRSETMGVYDKTPVGEMRRMFAAGQFPIPGDPAKMARAIIAAADAEKAPRRLTLGSDAYQSVHTALSTRLAEIEAQKDLAFSTDAEDG